MVGCHLLPRGVSIPCLFSLSAMALMETRPSFRKLTNRRTKSLDSHVRHALQCKVIVGYSMSRGELVPARKQPPYATAMPPTAECTCYASSIQLVGKTEIGSAGRHKFANDCE